MPEGGTPTSSLSGEAPSASQRQAQAPAQSAPQQQAATPQPAAQPAPPRTLQGAEVAAGSVALHLASYKQQANAERGWRELSGANGDLLGGARPIVRQVDVPGKGLFYRLYAGPIADMQNARALCAALKARNIYCAPMQL